MALHEALHEALKQRHDEAMEAHRNALAALERLATHHEETARRIRLVIELADNLAGESSSLNAEAQAAIAAANAAGHRAIDTRLRRSL